MAAIVNFSEFVQFPFKCFKVFGLIPYDADTVMNPKKKLQRKLLKIYNHLVIGNLTMSVLMMAIFVTQNITNLALITESLPATGYAGLAAIKAIMTYISKNDFKILMETLHGLFPKTKDEQKNFKIGEYFRSYKKMERTFSVLVFSTGVIFAAVPIVRFITTGVWIEKLPFQNWFPFNPLDWRYYNFVLLWEFTNTIHTLVSILGPDLLLYAFITLISMQFDILCYELRKVQNLKGKKAHEKIVKLVKVHETLIELPKHLEQVYSLSILVNFISSSVLICLVGYQVSIGVSFETLTKFASLLIASLVQVLMLCYYGQKLTSAGENVTAAVHDSGWETMKDQKLKKSLIMMIQRSQKPCTISALKFAVVSLPSFTTVRKHISLFLARFSNC